MEKICLFLCEDTTHHYRYKELFEKNKTFIKVCSGMLNFLHEVPKRPSFSLVILKNISSINLIELGEIMKGFRMYNIAFGLIHPETPDLSAYFCRITENDLFFYSGQEIDQKIFDALNQKALRV